MIRLERILAIQRLGKCPVEEKDGGSHCLTLVPYRHFPLLEQCARRSRHCLLLALHNSILLRGVRGGEMTLDTFIGAVGNELFDSELTIVVRAQHSQQALDLDLCCCLDLLDGRGSVDLSKDDLDPHVLSGIIHLQEEDSPAAWCRWHDRPTQISMH
jgi:hypothetical protein